MTPTFAIETGVPTPTQAVPRRRPKMRRHEYLQAVRKSEAQRVVTRRWGHLRRTYGITPEIFGQMLEAQLSQCAICETSLASGKPTHVDHDHATGRVRGLLCTCCNTAIGSLRDSLDLLERAAAYLRRYK